jgi:DNA-binding transcriptional MerR regulator
VNYKLDELARAASISPRTVRYYVQRGLLPAPAFRGKDTAYGAEHLVRLRAIRRLQDAFFPLDAIAVELERRTIAELERIADGTYVPTQPSNVAAPPVESVAERVRQMPEVSPSSSLMPGSGGPELAGARVFRRIEVAPGVELSIADDAPLGSRLIAERILREERRR